MRIIFIPFSKYEHIGGPTTFMVNLQRYLDACGYRYSNHPYFAKGIFFPVSYNKGTIQWIKLFGGKVIQRLDGVYYPSQHGPGYKSMNRDIEDIYRNLADFVVFQSEYSRKQAFEMMGKPKGKWEIIHNGVDSNVFSPDKNRTTLSEKIKFLMAGSFRKPAMIAPIVQALDSLKNEFDFSLTVAGPILEVSLGKYFERDYIVLAGSLDAKQLSDLHRNSDIFLHSQLNDNCPNAVLEAISCGLPVVGFESGSMTELLFFNKDLLAHVSDETFQKYEDFDPLKLAEKIRLCVTDYEGFKKNALEYCRQYGFNECGRRYVDVFEKVLQ